MTRTVCLRFVLSANTEPPFVLGGHCHGHQVRQGRQMPVNASVHLGFQEASQPDCTSTEPHL